jgi:hypothetical protein
MAPYRSSELATLRILASPKEERYYNTRGSVVMEENGKVSVDVSNSGIREERWLALLELANWGGYTPRFGFFSFLFFFFFFLQVFFFLNF